ncbi:(R)-mandelonitrile lyase [Amorphus coralli]|uniref:(R)-mandelonitrile lyase n=1 Tax=Amorphus coralli TaxID=340680 RepID=UPI0003728B67|nr:cupin domain-containing protein [Amorphus coralli]
MKLMRAGSTPSKVAPADYFTGTVWMDPVGEAEEPGRARALLVTFAPGARTNWHTHPYGQMLFVASGTGRCQSEGGPVRVLRPGDRVWFPAGERHWHGAAPDAVMSHIAIQEAEDGETATWQEPVSDADYAAAPAD